MRRRQLAYADRLTCNRQYQNQKESLRLWYETLAPEDKPPFPFSPGYVMMLPVQDAEETAVALETSNFLEELVRFLRQWQVMQLATWDLPVAQEPLEFATAGLVSHLLGAEQVVSCFPAYYDIPSSQDVRGEVREGQRLAARDAGIDEEYPLTDLAGRADQPSRWDRAFRCWLVEATFRRRYGQPWGVVDRLSEAFASEFTVSREHVKKIRRLYEPFLPEPTAR
jgi:hypothetical protein